MKYVITIFLLLLLFGRLVRRDEVIKEIYNAPKRRVDHEISRLSHNLHELMMHCKIIDVALSMNDDFVWKCRLALSTSAIGALGLLVGFASWTAST